MCAKAVSHVAQLSSEGLRSASLGLHFANSRVVWVVRANGADAGSLHS